MVAKEHDVRSKRKRPTLWISIVAAMAVVLVAGIVIVAVWSHIDSVPVKFVNNTSQAVILTDCGPDLEQINAGETSLINVYRHTKDCTFTGLHLSGSQTAGGCLVMPSPLEANTIVRVADARPVGRSHLCS